MGNRANDREPQEGRSGFPVFRKEEDYELRGRAMIEGINSTAAELIRGLQPFGPNYSTDPLYVLNDLWNRDKHRLLNFSAAKTLALGVMFQTPDQSRFMNINLPPPPYEDGTEIDRQPLPGPISRNVKVVGSVLSVGFQFIEAGPATGFAFPGYLLELVELTENILNKLAATVR